MVQAGDRLRLAVEAAADVLAGVQVRVQDLDGDDAPELGVKAAPHHGHPALADLLIQPVPAKLQRLPPRTPMSRSCSAGPARHTPGPRGKAAVSAQDFAGARERGTTALAL